MADNSKEQEWNKNESVPILHTTELEQEWNKNDFLEQKWNKNGPFLFNFRLQWWVERDLMKLERIDTAVNMADHFTKPLPRILFYRHRDFYMGHVPPTYSPRYNEVARVYAIDTDISAHDHKPITAHAASTIGPWDYIIRQRYLQPMASCRTDSTMLVYVDKPRYSRAHSLLPVFLVLSHVDYVTMG